MWVLSLLLIISTEVSCFKLALPHTKCVLSATVSPQVDQPALLPSLELPRDFLRAMLSSRTSMETKKMFMDRLQGIRVNMNKAEGQKTAYSDYLDSLLMEIDSVEGNVFASRKWPIALPFLQLKLGSCRRVLRIMLEEDPISQDESSSRRRRAMAVLLNQLARQKGGIRGVEADARRRTKRSTTMKEMLERTPTELETPSYEVIDARKTWEVRRYAPFSVCSTDLKSQQEQDSPTNMGFNSLAGYIFGKNVESKAMAMTTPVISSGNQNEKKMSFIMPSSFWNALDTAPTPLKGSGVKLEVGGGGLLDATNTVAVLWFGGYATADKVRLRKLELLDYINQDVKWKVKDGEEVRLFQYNDPFQPPWRRRNEVAIPVTPCT